MTDEERIQTIWSAYEGELEKISSWKKALIGAAIGAPALAGAAFLGQRRERQEDKFMRAIGGMKPGVAKERSKSRAKRLGAHAAAGLALGAMTPWVAARGARAVSPYISQAAKDTLEGLRSEMHTGVKGGVTKALEEQAEVLASKFEGQKREILGEIDRRISAALEGLGVTGQQMIGEMSETAAVGYKRALNDLQQERAALVVGVEKGMSANEIKQKFDDLTASINALAERMSLRSHIPGFGRK